MRVAGGVFLLVAFLNVGACTRSSRASARDSWSLEVLSAGSGSPRRLAYRWALASGTCVLKVTSRAEGLKVPAHVSLRLSLAPEEMSAEVTRVKVALEDVDAEDPTQQRLWARGIILAWDVTPTGRTVGIQSPLQAFGAGVQFLNLPVLVEELFPPLPGRLMGKGGRWRVHRTRAMGLPEGTGLGVLSLSETIAFTVADWDGDKAVLTGQGDVTVSGLVHPAGHDLKVSGGGSSTLRAVLDKGLLRHAVFEQDQRLTLWSDGRRRRSRFHVRAELDCSLGVRQ